MRAWRQALQRSVGSRELSGKWTDYRSISTNTALSRNVAAFLCKDNGSETVNDATVQGWVQSVRKQKNIGFAAIGDGSTIHSLQAVLKPEHAAQLSTGAAVRLHGAWAPSKGRGQSHELQVSKVEVLGENDAEHNPVQAKYQSAEFLRTVPHLRNRIPANSLLLRLRSQVIRSLTEFFDEREFVQAHPPVITSSDCEGAGEVFTISPNLPKEGSKNTKSLAEDNGEQVEHFFRNPKYLTVSAQLHLEALSSAVDKVWTLSPTFRAEKSDTPRHLSEFYMLEAEISFTEHLEQVMTLVEDMLRAVAQKVSTSRVYNELATKKPDIVPRWQGLQSQDWPRITYAQAIEILQTAHSSKSHIFDVSPSYEGGLQAEHERFLAQTVGEGSGKPVFVTYYPAAQKPFYMLPSEAAATIGSSSKNNQSQGTGETVACFDLLVPEICELVGGSLREHRLQPLEDAMRAKNVTGANLEWYKDLRRFGSVPHGGFGLGFDRLMCYLSGQGNVRDVVAFPRWYGRADC